MHYRTNALPHFFTFLLALAPLISSAITEGNYTYEVTDGKATITHFDCSYSGALSITNELGGFPVTSIGDWGFYECTALTSVTIPASVTAIGDWAFSTCYALTSVTIPDSVTAIGDGAFAYCFALASVTIPSSVTSIGDWAFAYCCAFTSVTIPDSVTAIGTAAFYSCDALTAVTIGASVTTIGGSAFCNCPSLASVTIPASVTTIGGSAFNWCASLTSVSIPASVTTIGDEAFCCCAALSSVLFTGDAPSIGTNAFNGTPATIYYLPNTTGWSSTFAGRPAKLLPLEFENQGDCIVITRLDNSFTGHLPLPAVLDGLPVTAIGDWAFSSCISLTSVTIPASVTAIGDLAFSSCISLTSVTVHPDNMNYASVDGVLFNKNLDVLIQCPGGFSGVYTIPDSVTSIGYGAFVWCDALTSVFFTGDAPSIGTNAFNGAPATIYYLPNTTGWSSTFAGCPAKLLPLEFENQGDCIVITRLDNSFTGHLPLPAVLDGLPVTAIGDRAFAFCCALTSVTIPASVTTIGDYAFSYCDALTSVTIGDSVTAIGDLAFYYCNSLTSITIGDSVTAIGDYAFSSCISLASVTVHPDNMNYASVDGVLFNKNLDVLIQCPGGFSGVYTIPTSVTTIGDYAFSTCYDLTSVTIGNSVTIIGDEAFCYCYALTSVTIGASVTSIGDKAFAYCNALTSVTIPDSVTSIGSFAFEGCSSLTSVAIGNSVTTIGDEAFCCCYALTSVLFTGDAPTIGTCTFNEAPTTIYYLPSTTGWGTTLAGCPTCLWNPTVQRDAAFGFASGRFGFNIAGTPDIPVKIEATTNLAAGIWTPVTNATLDAAGSLYINDPSSSNQPSRFYRIVWP